jgi:hypothetical protein
VLNFDTSSAEEVEQEKRGFEFQGSDTNHPGCKQKDDFINSNIEGMILSKKYKCCGANQDDNGNESSLQSCNDSGPRANNVYQMQPSISVSDINLDRSNVGTSQKNKF